MKFISNNKIVTLLFIALLLTGCTSESVSSVSTYEDSNYYKTSIVETQTETKAKSPAYVPSKPSIKGSEGSDCHPSYSGCLKASASDYDCRGGSGNGPYYTGKVRVTGPDVFGLDRDNDGWGCE